MLVIEKKTFTTKRYIREENQQNENEIRLKYSKIKSNIKKDLKEKKLSKSDAKEKILLANQNFLSELEKQKLANKNRLENIQVNKKRESNNEKEARQLAIKKIKIKLKTDLKEHRIIQKTLESGSPDYEINKSNIKTIKNNAKYQIDEINSQVIFPPLKNAINIFKNLIRNFFLFFKKYWNIFSAKHPNIAQFLIFFLISNGVTILQFILMPGLKSILNQTNLVDISFQFGQIGTNLNGSPYYMFDYASGPIIDGVGGGLAYFLSVQITLAIAQVINFFLQRNVTFKSKSNPWIAAIWYFLAYLAITFIAAALQGLYKAPIYNLLMNSWNMGSTGELFADFITMFINSAISFWVFFPIFKIIFKDKKKISA